MKDLQTRIDKLIDRQLQTIFEMSFIRTLSKETQKELGEIEDRLVGFGK